MKKSNLVTWVLVLAILLIGTSYAYGKAKNNFDADAAAEQKTDAQVKSSEEPIAIPDFALYDYDTNKVNFSDFAGKTVVLNLWASWCPPCKAEMPEFNELDKQFKQSGEAVLLSINSTDGQQETKETALEFLKKNQYTMDVYYDEGLTIAAMFGIRSMPVTLVIDKNGNLFDYAMGQTTKEVVLQMVTKANEVK